MRTAPYDAPTLREAGSFTRTTGGHFGWGYDWLYRSFWGWGWG
ncbi:MAG: lasso RiPP family leader peptide-containing protein, partial [Frankia sp.]|nr:lasso RiPP family leader peptide-containing protein [Frankia sp.]